MSILKKQQHVNLNYVLYIGLFRKSGAFFATEIDLKTRIFMKMCLVWDKFAYTVDPTKVNLEGETWEFLKWKKNNSKCSRDCRINVRLSNQSKINPKFTRRQMLRCCSFVIMLKIYIYRYKGGYILDVYIGGYI